MNNHFSPLGIPFSQLELKLIEHYDLEPEFADTVGTITLYKMMMERAFLANDQSPYAEAVRKCITAFNNGTVYRMTPEWDALLRGIEHAE